MIIGIGIDLTEIARVKHMLETASGARFLERVLTMRERELADRRRGRLAEFTAGRFAAKEAVVKALGCGIGKQVGFQDIEVLPGELGRPECQISDEALQRLGLTGQRLRIHLSITHSSTTAAANAVIERVDYPSADPGTVRD